MPNAELTKWLFERGNVLIMLNQYDKAIEAYTYAIKLKPDYIQAYKNRGVAYAENKQDDFAITDYNAAIKLKHNDVELYYI